MRRWFAALLLIGFATPAAAGDFDVPTLRGSSPFIPAAPKYAPWSGFYVGGQVGQGSALMNFENATQSLISFLLRTTVLENEQRPSEWGVLGRAHPGGVSYGAFFGYNSQWDDVIVGVDVHYNRTNVFANAPVAPITRATSAGGLSYVVTVTGDASMRITDFGSARARAGWIVGNFLPYVTGGFALGRADVARSANVFVTECTTDVPPVCGNFTFAGSEGKSAAFIYGWSLGGGMDVLLMPNFFVRLEYEYIQFSRIQGIDATLSTARVGAGIKF